MINWKKFSRAFLFTLLIIGLCAGLVVPRLEQVEAAPREAISSYAGKVVISEFRTIGSGGTDDEFIEIFNRSNEIIPIGNWEINKSSGCATGDALLTAIDAGISLDPGQHYLIANAPAYTGAFDQTYTTAQTIANDGGLALLDGPGGAFVDQVGMCNDTLYKEGTSLSPLSKSVDQSYERKDLGCIDTDDNFADFNLNPSSSNPQPFSDIPLPCVRVVNVTSTNPNATYVTGNIITITIEFNVVVTVTGTPTLLLETGLTHRNATYISGSGSKTLSFKYIVAAGDVSGDLNYVTANSLSLNGGSIIGAAGNAVLTLPNPASAGSLGSNKDIVIDDGAAPFVVSFKRHAPVDARTNVNSLIFRVTFSEAVINVDEFDFLVTGATGTTISISGSNNIYDLTVSGGNLGSLNDTVGLDLNSPSITDSVGTLLSVTEPTIDETYILDHTPPNLTIEQASGQPDPDDSAPVNFKVEFSESIDASTFTPSDITQDITATSDFVTWSISDSGNHKIFTLSATSVAQNGTLIPIITANKVKDIAGNDNQASTGIDNVVTFNDDIRPTVTVNQSATQPDPTIVLPVKFDVVFSEPINVSTFTNGDITQNGSATGVTWSIVDSGDHKSFALSATAVGSIFGTLQPSIDANLVLDIAGNNNKESTKTDNSVLFDPRPTATPTSLPSMSVIISEVAWAGTSANSNDEWVELYNTGGSPVNITGWQITDGFTPVILSGTIPARGYFLLESREQAVSVASDQISSSLSLSNSGEALQLLDVSSKVIDSANKNGGSWPAGSSSTYGTMERIFILTDSDSAWITNIGVIKNGKDAGGNDIWGTPKQSSSPTATPLPPPTNTPTRVPDRTLLINEVAWMGTSSVNYGDEWIELYNPNSRDINLTGWKLVSSDGALNVNLTGTIRSGKYFILAHDDDVFTDLTVDQVFSGTITNYGASLLLRDPSNTVIDTANSDFGYWPAGSSLTYSTMERYRNMVDGTFSWVTFAGTLTNPVHNRDGDPIKGTPGRANWAISVTITPTSAGTATRTSTPFRTPTPSLEGRLIINEFLVRPGYDWNQDGSVDVFDEFIEIKNIGNENINIRSWEIDDVEDAGSEPFQLPDLTLKPGQRIVYFGLQTNILLSDGGDTVRLIGPNGKEYDKVKYSVVKTEDKSSCRLPDGNGSWYQDCIPTPNLINSREGTIPSMPGGEVFESPVCSLPDTLPVDFLFAECRGYGAGIWRFMYWDFTGWQGYIVIPEYNSKWKSFLE